MNKDDGKEMPVRTSRLLPDEMYGVAIAIISTVISSDNDIFEKEPVNLRIKRSILTILLKLS